MSPPKKTQTAGKKTSKKKAVKKASSRKRNTAQKAIRTVGTEAKKPVSRGGPLEISRHERFARECVRCVNATQAARAVGVSEASASVQASRWLKNVKIVARIKELEKRATCRIILRKREALAILSEQARARLIDFLPYLNDLSYFLEIAPSLSGATAIKKIKLDYVVLKGADGVESIKTVIKDIEFHDPRAALQQLSTLLGWDHPKDQNNFLEDNSLKRLLDEIDGTGFVLPADTGECDNI